MQFTIIVRGINSQRMRKLLQLRYISGRNPVWCISRFYHNDAGTAEAFSGIVRKEFEISGIASEVVDLDRFEIDTFRWVIFYPKLR